MSATNQKDHTATQPHFSAFALMILILLGIFAIISRIDIVMPDMNPTNEKTETKPNNNTEDDKTHIKEVIAKRQKEENSNEEFTNSEYRLRRPVTSKNFEIKKNNDNEKSEPLPSYPVVPCKPMRGDKLSSEKFASTDFIPAEKNAEKPSSLPKKIISYKSAPTFEKLKRVRKKQKYHVMRKDETLWRIARQEYGKGKYWKEIVKANNNISPQKVRPGTRIFLPSPNEIGIKGKSLLAQVEEE
jgi:nucleoid-associated protein YgaU